MKIVVGEWVAAYKNITTTMITGELKSQINSIWRTGGLEEYAAALLPKTITLNLI